MSGSDFKDSSIRFENPMEYFKFQNVLVPGRVTASTAIPQGASSLPIDPEQVKGHTDIVQLSVRCNLFEILELDDSSKNISNDKVHWTRNIRLSDDCHNFNVQLKVFQNDENNKKLVLQTVRPIDAGQELLLWFSEDVLAMFQMAFLTPANIQGQKKYVCNTCSKMYESPNPLKLHITLSCERYTIKNLWEKLSSAFTDQPEVKQSSFSFKLYQDTTVNKQKSAIDLSVTPSNAEPSLKLNKIETKNSENIDNKIYRPFVDRTHSSAFRPFQKNEQNILNNAHNNLSLQQPMMMWPMSPIPQDYYNMHNHPLNLQRLDEEAHIETIVSSLGKSKQGHVCLYCGKCYSRKYGLKIHIRTHTGYKPLKCKYCLRPFGDPSNLNKHVRLHAEGETPYKCDLCGKVLVRRRDLERHLKSRHMNEIHPEKSVDDDTDVNSVSMSEDENSSSTVDI